MRYLPAFMLLLTYPVSAVHAELTFPDRGTAAVVDAAHVLKPSTVEQLNLKLVAWEKSTHHQLVVATVPSLNGTAISDYGYQLGRHWKLGRTGADDGIILLLAPNERLVRIEVGKGLEGVMTDAMSSQIIQTTIKPQLKVKDPDAAMIGGSDVIMSYINNHEVDVKKAPVVQQGSDNIGIILGLLLTSLIALLGLSWWWSKRQHQRIREAEERRDRIMEEARRKTLGTPPYRGPVEDTETRYPGPSYSSSPSPSYYNSGYSSSSDDDDRKRSVDSDISFSSGGSSSLSSDDIGFTSSNTDDSSFGGGGADSPY